MSERPMTRERAIGIIESTFPADDHELGPELLRRAKERVQGWRSEPDGVLFEYARLCIEEDQRQANEAERRIDRQRRGY